MCFEGAQCDLQQWEAVRVAMAATQSAHYYLYFARLYSTCIKGAACDVTNVIPAPNGYIHF